MSQIQQAVWSVNRDVPLANPTTVGELYTKSMARTSFTLVMLSVAGGMTLLLGIVGIYGVISYAVSQRTREIGIRIALGAQRSAMIRMFVLQGLTLTGIGVVCGLSVAFATMRLIRRPAAVSRESGGPVDLRRGDLFDCGDRLVGNLCALAKSGCGRSGACAARGVIASMRALGGAAIP